jgi:O-antigen/teichoic acid export membrane protein
MSPSRRIIKNAFANLCRGGALALVSILLPPFLTRILPKDTYGTWLLILQLSTYISFLDFGVQTTVGRFVAHYNELGEVRGRDSILSTALAILTGSGLLAIAGVFTLAWQLPSLFKSMPAELHQDAQLALLCIGVSLAISLPFSVFIGIFVGLQRYDIPGWITGGTKLLGGVFVILTAHASHSIVMMAVVMGIINISGGFLHFLAYKSFTNDIQLSGKLISRNAGKEISSYCLSLSTWTLSMLLVSGLDTIVIGYFDYEAVTSYVLANSIVVIIAGIQGSVISVLMPKAAMLGSKSASLALGRMLVDSTRYGMLILLSLTTFLIVFEELIMSFWIDEQYRGNTILFLNVLLIANVIKLSAYPYAVILIGAGQQQKVLITPIIEGLINLIASILLASLFGGIGVGIGTIIGALVGVMFNIFYNMKNTKEIESDLGNYLFNGLFRPFICFTPMICLSIFHPRHLDVFFLLIIVVAVFMTSVAVFRFTLVPTEREKVLSVFYGR